MDAPQFGERCFSVFMFEKDAGLAQGLAAQDATRCRLEVTATGHDHRACTRSHPRRRNTPPRFSHSLSEYGISRCRFEATTRVVSGSVLLQLRRFHQAIRKKPSAPATSQESRESLLVTLTVGFELAYIFGNDDVGRILHACAGDRSIRRLRFVHRS